MVRVEYIRVSHRTSVLAKASVVPDSHTIDVVAKRCVDQITCKQSKDNRFSITQDARAFHISVSKGFTVICAADKDIPRYLAFRLLEDIQEEVGKTYGMGCMGDFKQAFTKYLLVQIERVNDQVNNMILDASAEEELNQVVGTSTLNDLSKTTKKSKKGDAPPATEEAKLRAFSS
ncbi:hypothetical protein CYMTET_29840 [Cymbomonas tetramitiformis]|uniref:Longin domain-containing protein n=1 Tax=Cymbomonas tetramitiformis TaxID=36881 RepID=A0AAE0KUJ1_9CHLO|nr:hypothetical protein CYMTET_29840 [Cymbomonas tetramitiformis]